jgi:superoxide dismutase, Cu-Zn family
MKTLAILLVACSTAALAQTTETAKAELRDATGKSIGIVVMNETPHGVLMHATLMGAPPGVHAFHVHTTGACEPPFTSAGGHFNPAAKQHGAINEMGMHAGDMPNVVVPADGNLAFDVLNSNVTLIGGQPNSLFKAGGTALMMHATADDYKGDPAGNAGARVACGLIIH